MINEIKKSMEERKAKEDAEAVIINTSSL